MLLWESVKGEFVWEGSWRDICVPGMRLDGWQAALKAIGIGGFRTQFTIAGKVEALPEDVAPGSASVLN